MGILCVFCVYDTIGNRCFEKTSFPKSEGDMNGGSMVWGFCVYFVYMIPLETDVLRKYRFQKAKGIF